jgi:hypothetical protein
VGIIAQGAPLLVEDKLDKAVELLKAAGYVS